MIRQQRTCPYCEKKCDTKLMAYDHIKPKSKGGSNLFSNKVLVCYECNSRKCGLDFEILEEVKSYFKFMRETYILINGKQYQYYGKLAYEKWAKLHPRV